MRRIILLASLLPCWCWAITAQNISALESMAFKRYSEHTEFSFSDTTQIEFPPSVINDLSSCTEPALVDTTSANKKLAYSKIKIACKNDTYFSFRAPVIGSIKVFRSTEFTKKDIPLNAVQLKEVFVPIKEAPKGFFTGNINTSRLSLKSNIRLNEILLNRDLKRTEDVLKNQKITAIAEVSGIKIQIEAIALQDGIIGETIRVENLNSGKRFTAVVSHKGKVRVVK